MLQGLEAGVEEKRDGDEDCLKYFTSNKFLECFTCCNCDRLCVSPLTAFYPLLELASASFIIISVALSR